MSDDIPFDRTFDLVPGTVEEVAPACAGCWPTIRARSPSSGTVSYIIGHGRAAIVDPGPNDQAHANEAAPAGDDHFAGQAE